MTIDIDMEIQFKYRKGNTISERRGLVTERIPTATMKEGNTDSAISVYLYVMKTSEGFRRFYDCNMSDVRVCLS